MVCRPIIRTVPTIIMARPRMNPPAVQTLSSHHLTGQLEQSW